MFPHYRVCLTLRYQDSTEREKIESYNDRDETELELPIVLSHFRSNW